MEDRTGRSCSLIRCGQETLGKSRTAQGPVTRWMEVPLSEMCAKGRGRFLKRKVMSSGLGMLSSR